ncbi:MAG: YjgN family protein [Pseudomonadota bacterium]
MMRFPGLFDHPTPRRMSTPSLDAENEPAKATPIISDGGLQAVEIHDERTIPIEFTGQAGVYFRIWIVNLCLTLLTLGIFSAWAKVRKKRYFYASVRIDDSPMQYLAEPIPILKGRLVAAALLFIWWFSSSFYLPALPWVLGAGLIIAPWIVASSAAFNARYSAWRNLTFVFHGNYLGAAVTIYWLGLIPIVILGLMFDGSDSGIIGELVSALGWLALLVILAAGVLFPWWLNRLKRFIATNTSYGTARVVYGARGGQFFGVYFMAGFILLLAAILSAMLAFFVGGIDPDSSSQLFLLTIPVYLGYVFAFAYVRANVTNLVWNQAHLGSVSFLSTMRGGELFALYLTNALAIIATVGLAIPWAVMRTMRYRVEHLSARTDRPLSDFIGDDRSNVRAAAAETGDFFDLDLSL